MIQHVWSVLCTSSSIDSETNNVTLFKVLEAIQATARHEPPPDSVVPVQAELISLWQRLPLDEPSHGVSRILILDPGEKEPRLTGAETEINLALDKSRLRTITKFAGIPVFRTGLHFVTVEFRPDGSEDFTEVARLPLEVKISISEDHAEASH